MFLGIDIGGTNIRVSAFADPQNHDAISDSQFRSSRDYRNDFETLLQTCALMNSEYRDEHGAIEGIGVAIAGVLNSGRTELIRAGNTAHWVGQPFVRQLGKYFGCRTVLGNDAEAAAMAEAMYGNPYGGDFWFVIWGTGIGGTLVRYIDGKPHAFAGEMGHMPIDGSGLYRCGCGQYGCLEAFCGGAMIASRFGPANELDADRWNSVVSRMASGLKLVVTSQPVERVYFSGGIAAHQQHLIPELERRLRNTQGLVETPVFELSMFGESAGTAGALALLKRAPM